MGMGHRRRLLFSWRLCRRSAVVTTLPGAALSTMRFVIAPSAHRRLTTLAKNHIRCSRAMRVFAERRVRIEARSDDERSRWKRIEMREVATRALTNCTRGFDLDRDDHAQLRRTNARAKA